MPALLHLSVFLFFTGPTEWRDTLEKQVAMRRKCLKEGLRRSVELSVTDAPIFRLQSRPGSDLGNPSPRLRDLLKTCIPGTSPLTEEKRKNHLRVSDSEVFMVLRRRVQSAEELGTITSLRHIAFANPDMTHRIQAEEDLAARVIGSCFVALVGKKLSADIDWNYTQGSRDVMFLLGQPGAIEFAGIVSLISASADSLVGDAMPSDVLDVFKETIGLPSEPLLAGGQANVPQPQVEHFHKIYSEAPNWLKDELKPISDRM
ncbi:hypothetical protein EDB83DRAFT_2534417 [Lactarius deliciosus]|nr:hypothetical protein EDB83DRAFT_2534417 [Lactarius deliciosus]